MAEHVVVTVSLQPVVNEAVTAALRYATSHPDTTGRCCVLRAVAFEVQADDPASLQEEEMPFQKAIGLAA